MTWSTDPLRVAIVGAGPAGLYAAKTLLADPRIDLRVSMLDSSPAPWGLVRTGVAPDHVSTKGATRQFHRTISDPRFQLFLNTEVGGHLTHADLLAHHHAVVYATGASAGRPLLLPGEPLRGVHDAIEFAGWYNGDLRYRDIEVDLTVDHATIIGNGNVALDIARILTTDPTALELTDVADYALKVLASSHVRRVTILGRRGPEHAAFTTPELIGLSNTVGVRFSTNADDVGNVDVDDALQGFRLDLLRSMCADSRPKASRHVSLRFCESPVSLRGRSTVQSIEVADSHGGTRLIDAGLVIKSIGSIGRPLTGVPFDQASGIIPNKLGRVIDERSDVVRGVYVTGWCKRGASGVIGTNKRCAAETVDKILRDRASEALGAPRPHVDFGRFVLERNPDALSTTDWWNVDGHEVDAGMHTRPRRKLLEREAFVAVARRSSS